MKNARPAKAGLTESVPITVSIRNLHAIACVYGEPMARSAFTSILSQLNQRIGSWNCLITPDYGATSITIKHIGSKTNRFEEIENVVRFLALQPVHLDQASVVLALNVERGRPNAQSFPPYRPNPRYLARYRADMAAAVSAYDALSSGRMDFVEQAIASVDQLSGLPLYNERLVRLGKDDGQTIAPNDFIPALERLGLIRAFDFQVVTFTIDQLCKRPRAVLGCNVSAMSAVHDSWWDPVLSELSASPKIASRLIIEITETAHFQDVDSALELFNSLRNCGCRIALDDFGTGASSATFARRAPVDIIKIDRSFVSHEDARVDANFRLKHIVTLASALAQDVVVEGIETAKELALVRDIGGRWVQGYFIDAANAGIHTSSPAITTLASSSLGT